MNILITSAGRRSYIVEYFKQALSGSGLVHAGNSINTPALQVADRAVIMPLIWDPGYVDFLIDYCKLNDISVVIPLFDIDLPILAKSKARFLKESIHAIVSDYDVTVLCNDKWKTCNFFTEIGVQTPKTYLSPHDACTAIKNKAVSFPLIIKPRWGMGSIGVYSADNIEGLNIFYGKSREDSLKTYLHYESDQDTEHSVIIQEKLNGQEYGLDVINDLEKNYVTTFVKKKIAMRSGETDCAVTEDNPLLKNIGKKISTHLRHIGNLDVDCFICQDKLYVLEINCRFGGNYPFSHLAGANIPLAIINWVQGVKPSDDLFKMKYGVCGAKDIKPIILYDKAGQ